MSKPKVPFKKDDLVVVTAGKDKGKTGKVLKVFPESQKVIVEKLNFIKEFIRRDQSKNVSGGVMEKEAPIHISNLLIFCNECGSGVRMGNKRLEDGNKIRVCSKCDISLEKS
jgi:large subunit ribosomal protein L24